MIEATLKGGQLARRNATRRLQGPQRFIEFEEEVVYSGQGDDDGVNVLGR